MRLFITLILLSLLAGCAPSIVDQEASAGDQQPAKDVSLERKTAIIEDLIRAGALDSAIDAAERAGKDIIFTMQDRTVYTMDEASGIVYCVQQPYKEKRCHEAYFTYLDSSIIVDNAKGYSCIPSDSAAACDPSTSEKYLSLKELVKP